MVIQDGHSKGDMIDRSGVLKCQMIDKVKNQDMLHHSFIHKVGAIIKDIIDRIHRGNGIA